MIFGSRHISERKLVVVTAIRCGPWRPLAAPEPRPTVRVIGCSGMTTNTVSNLSNWICYLPQLECSTNGVFTRWQHAAATCWWFAFHVLWRPLTLEPIRYLSCVPHGIAVRWTCSVLPLGENPGILPAGTQLLPAGPGSQQRALLEQSSYCRRNCWRKYWFYCSLQLKIKCPSSKNQWHLYCVVSVSKLTSSYINHLKANKRPVNADALKIMNIKDREITKNFSWSRQLQTFLLNQLMTEESPAVNLLTCFL